MKLSKKIIVLFMAFALFTVSAVGCNNGDNGDGKNGGENSAQSTAIKETDYDLVLGGSSDYKVVIADAPFGYEAYAAQEMVKYVAEATQIELPIVAESTVSVSDASKLIFVGETAATAAAGVSADKNQYGARGFVIKQADSNVYIVGGDSMGTMYGVYEFLHHEFGFEPYAIDEVAINKGVINKKLLAFDMHEIPDIAHIQGIQSYWAVKTLEGHRMRFNHFTEVFVNATGQPWHNSLEYAPPSEYKYSHPKWYTENGLQYHYTAHGDEEELEALKQAIFEKIVFFVERDFAQGKYYEQIGFMSEDYDNSWAQSDYPYNQGENDVDSVAVLKEKYGKAYAAAMLIHFINDVQERVSQYMSEHHDGRKMSITFFAYLETENAPVKQDADGNYVPIDESVVLHKDANVLIAPIRNDYIRDYNESSVKATVESWKAIASNFSFWFYDYYFSTTTMIHVDSTYSLQSYFQAARDAHATWVFVEAPQSDDCYYAFDKLKVYLISKLGWDVNADVHTLIDDFFRNYYKDAYVYMKRYFDELTSYFAYLKQTTNITGVCGSSGADNSVYWKEGAVSGWIDLIGEAFKAIEPLKYSDAEMYEKLYGRILYDSLMPRYILLKHFAKEAFTDQTFIEEFGRFKADAKSLGVKSAIFNIDDLILTR